MNIDNIIKQLSKQSAGKFLHIKNYKNNKGEVKNYTINFKLDYKKAIEKSVIKLFKFNPTTEEEKQAKEDILTSLKDYFNSTENVYIFNNKPVAGLKQDSKGKIFITGLLANKTNVEAKSVKDKIYQTLPISKFRQFELSSAKMDSISVNKKNIKVG